MDATNKQPIAELANHVRASVELDSADYAAIGRAALEAGAEWFVRCDKMWREYAANNTFESVAAEVAFAQFNRFTL